MWVPASKMTLLPRIYTLVLAPTTLYPQVLLWANSTWRPAWTLPQLFSLIPLDHSLWGSQMHVTGALRQPCAEAQVVRNSGLKLITSKELSPCSNQESEGGSNSPALIRPWNDHSLSPQLGCTCRQTQSQKQPAQLLPDCPTLTHQR